MQEHGAPGSSYSRAKLKPISGAAFATAEALRMRSLNHSRSQASFASSQIGLDHPAETLRHGKGPGRTMVVPGAMSASSLDASQRWSDSEIRGRPPNDGQRAAGRPSGQPVMRDCLTKFEKMPAREVNDTRGLAHHQLQRTRWQTHKYDPNWHAFPSSKPHLAKLQTADLARPYAPSDLSGFPKVYFG